MCGIVGYIGKNGAIREAISALKKLEYRGYDSAGVAALTNFGAYLKKSTGRIDRLVSSVDFNRPATIAIAHTRWATHGEPNDANAHPHSDCKKEIFVVHNGIIENYKTLREKLTAKGHQFTSHTDTEVIPHLLEEFLHRGRKISFLEALAKTLSVLRGSYAIAALYVHEPDKIFASKLSSPLLIGRGHNENIIASDPTAVLRLTRNITYPKDGDIVELSGKNVSIYTAPRLTKVKREIDQIDWDIESASKEGYPHFMLKEIFQQPESLKDTFRGRLISSQGKVKLGGLEEVRREIKSTERLVITACGTAYLAGLFGKYIFEELSGVKTEAELASELRYSGKHYDKHSALLCISQSGETADTLSALQDAKRKGVLCLGLVNVVGSSISRETDAGVYLHAGPEIGVASTKAFTSQLAALALMSVLFAQEKGISKPEHRKIVRELGKIPSFIEQIIKQNEAIKNLAKKYLGYKNFLFLGRKYSYPVALEGALKLKEIAYVHAEGYSAGEMKHGPIAMVDKNFPSIFVIPKDSVYEKTFSNMEEIKARKGPVIAVTSEGDKLVKKIADDVIYIPNTLEVLNPLLCVVPLQLFAYHFGVLTSKDVDKPRNLAKSVTVE